MVIALAAQPLAVFADTYDAEEYPLHVVGVYPVADDPPSLFDSFPGFRPINLTEEAREIALYDFDYLANMLLQTAPTRHMFYRVIGSNMEDYLNNLRSFIYNMEPIPSFTAVLVCEDRWAEEPTDPLMIAADYLLSLLIIMQIELSGFGHFGSQPRELVYHTFFSMAYGLYHEDPDPAATIQWFEELGMDAHWAIESNRRFANVMYEIHNTPSVLWFYDINPSEFNFYIDLFEAVGTMHEDNITTQIIESGKIAYFHIASFMNNLILDSETLFPFYEEIHDFEHLIIDVRGNGGGMAGYFPHLVVSMLIGDDISFAYPEFFVANDLTAALFEYPPSLAGANLYGTFPAADFVRDQDMHLFNRDDLEILDYVVVWEAVYRPMDDSIPFGGKIWLLVDEFSASASVMAAMISQNTGFATVVGEPTSRVTGVVFTFAALPNTGVLFRIDLGYTTDQYGRSIEEFGVIPQIANQPGMDALETVLAIIASADEPAPEEPAPPTLATRYIDGVAFIQLRDVVNNLGVYAEWDGPNQSVIITTADGSTLIIAISSYGVINLGGRVYVPVENIEYIFAEFAQ